MKRVGLVVGVFDLFHVGHVRLLREARARVDELVVVINGDRLTGAYKRQPIMSEAERHAVVAAIRFVDHCVISDTFEVIPHVDAFGVTHILHGDDWPHHSYLAQIRLTEQALRDRGLSMVYLPYTRGVSTTGLIRRCADAAARVERQAGTPQA